MRRAALLATVAMVGIGCGGSLSGGPDATGSAGTSGLLGIAGSRGTGLIGGGGPAGMGGAPEDLFWGSVQVHIASTAAVASGLTLDVSDQAATLNVTLQFPPATHFGPTDGAGVGSQTICGLEKIWIYSCAGQNPEDVTAAAAGCLVALLEPSGATGEFIHPNGVHCSVKNAAGIINLPPSSAPRSEAATGTFVLECATDDGTALKLQGTFALPADQWFRSLC